MFSVPMENLIMFCLVVFSISSMWLYSPGLIGSLRNWFLSYFENSNIKYLAICQLCCSFWIGMIVYFFMFGWSGIVAFLVMAFIASGISWMLGSFTGAALFLKAIIEDKMSQRNE